jgi:ABC-type polysaccharide/polyol phosphate export permease
MRSSATTTYDSANARLQSIVELQEVWRYRYLVRNLVSRDLKVRYKRSALGFLWVTINPLMIAIVLTIVFSYLFGKTQPNYPVFVLGGLLIWNLFAQGSVAAMSNLIGNGPALRRIYIPPSVFVISAVGSALVNLAFTIGPFFIIAFALHAPLRFTWLYVPVACVQAMIFTLGLGLIVATLMVFFNDIYEIYLVLLTAYNYLTPVYYPINILPPFMQALERFNPMYLYISAVQKAVVGSSVTINNVTHVLPPSIPSLTAQAAGWLAALVVFAVGWLLFTRMEDKFAYHF